jgi:predicted small metal-binding protein
MRAIDCPCGKTLQADTDENLADAVRDHAAEDHPDMDMSGDQAEQMVSAEAYDAADS